jgi:hypothetical protein
MMKLKSIVYRYTGIYLAKKEEAVYVASQEHKDFVDRCAAFPEKDMDRDVAKDLSIGLWQSKHNFARPISFLGYEYPPLIFVPLAWIVVFCTVLKWDVKDGVAWLKNSSKRGKK